MIVFPLFLDFWGDHLVVPKWERIRVNKNLSICIAVPEIRLSVGLLFSPMSLKIYGVKTHLVCTFMGKKSSEVPHP